MYIVLKTKEKKEESKVLYYKRETKRHIDIFTGCYICSGFGDICLRNGHRGKKYLSFSRVILVHSFSLSLFLSSSRARAHILRLRLSYPATGRL